MKKYEVAKVVFALVIITLLALILTFQVQVMDAEPKKYDFKVQFVPDEASAVILVTIADGGWDIVSVRRATGGYLNSIIGSEYVLRRVRTKY
jgi:hypothetical protein